MEGFKEDLVQIVPYLESLLPGKGAVARFQRMAQFAVLRDPKLLECTKKSLLLALLWCAQKDLEPGVEDGCWLIPFKGKVVPVPAYKGLLNRAVDVGAVLSVDPVAVYENDEFFYCFGLEPDLKHTPPKLGTARGELIGAYVTITLPNGEKKFKVMDRDQIEKIRNSGAAWKAAPNTGPWADWEEAQFLKTIIKQGLKTVPMRSDFRDLISDDGMIEVGAGVGALLTSAGTEVPESLKGEDLEGAASGTDTADQQAEAAKAKIEKEKLDTAAFDALVATELAPLTAEAAKLRLIHLEENLKITAKNTKKTVPAFKVYAAPYFHPYVNDKQEPKEGYWKVFLAWEAAQYPPPPVEDPGPEQDPGPGTGAGEGEGPEGDPGPGEAVSPGTIITFEDRKRAATMECLKKILPPADLNLEKLADISPDNIDEIEAKIKAWEPKKK